jgi:hypothetical protein
MTPVVIIEEDESGVSAVIVGWNVYIGTTDDDLQFSEFIPNEPVLAIAAGKLADEVEQHAAAGDMDGGPPGATIRE